MKDIGRLPARLASGVRAGSRGPFYALCVLLVLVMLMGGGARGDIASLEILRPIAVLALGYGLWSLTREQIRTYRYLFIFAVAMLVLTLIQLVPLPPAIWTALPGRELIVEIDRAAGLGQVWRPISVAPATTWNSFYAMLVPLAILVLGAQVPTEERSRLVPLVIALGLLSALIALLQILGPADGPLYFYRVTNSGAAVGLFANRNHQAFLLAAIFPLLAVFASMPRDEKDHIVRRILALGAGMFLIPLILITGSRLGLAVAVAGIASTLILYRPAIIAPAAPSGPVHASGRRGDLRSRPAPAPAWRQWAVAGGVAVAGLGVSVATIYLGRGEAFQRIMAQDGEELRFKAWNIIAKLIMDYFPFGSGMGSFVEVFKVAEPRNLLDATYLNHAHNDWLETVLTGGLPAFFLLAFACVLVVMRAVRLWPRGSVVTKRALFSRLGLVLVVQFAIASFGDYPLRTPALGSLFVIAALWAATSLRDSGDSVDAREGFPHGGKN
ncbi:O-antigen ligase family protein [Sphingomonas soli]|uniref:O-antigen ligase family protein n=1 Tax=Sphingomonas soli TaxID=266127 RepID=UPI000836F58A|nr:O-antigen ligase family protein [Sphingomonas soli]